MSLPFLDIALSPIDNKVIDDVNLYFQDFIRHGEKSKAVKPIKEKNLKQTLLNYGVEFSKVLNNIYEEDGLKFRMSNVVKLENSLIAAIFKFDKENQEPEFGKDLSKLGIENLTYDSISSKLSVNRIVKLYPQKDTIVFVKPDQYRYWLSSTAYRDADKCFFDLSRKRET